jgi:hypothetical protein
MEKQPFLHLSGENETLLATDSRAICLPTFVESSKSVK